VTRALGSGQVYELADPLGNLTKREWTAEWNKHSATDPLGQITRWEYDDNANLTKIVDRLGRTTTFTYNSQNRRTKKTDARGNASTYTYTSKGDLKVETDAEAGSVDHDYDDTRLMTQVTDARNKVTSWTYDARGQRATETRPDGSRTTWTRDPWGRVTETRVGGTTPSNATDGVPRDHSQARFDASRGAIGRWIAACGTTLLFSRAASGTERPLARWGGMVDASTRLSLLSVDRAVSDLPPVQRLQLLGLSRREAEIALLIGRGLRQREVAAGLFVTEGTVKTTLVRVRRKIGLRSTRDLVHFLLQSGLVGLGQLGEPDGPTSPAEGIRQP
jgi:YD repeat-containing protein